MDDFPHTTKEQQQEIEFSISRGSVPCIPRTTDLTPSTHSVPAVFMQLVRRNATSNLLMSIISLIAMHLAVPLVHVISATFAMYVSGIMTLSTLQSSGNPTQFTPTHLFFMSPTGSDAANGLTPATAWATPNHAVSCGDVILAATGDYSTDFTTNGLNFGTVSSCPSTAAGIDGTGGIYFATILCAGASVGDCHTSSIIWDIGSNNWGVQGWKVDYASVCTGNAGSGCGSGQRAFELDGGGAPLHHFAIINNICYKVASCVHAEDAGFQGSGHGIDYMGVVGNISVLGSLNSSFPEGAFDAAGITPLDQNAGSHVYLNTNYAAYSDCGTDCDNFDSESFLFDTWDAHPNNNNLGVVSNNISWKSKRYCVNMFTGSIDNVITPTFKVYNNTCFNNLANIANDSSSAEIYISLNGNPWTVQVYNNIVFNSNATSGASHPVYAFLSGGGLNSGSVVGGTGIQNIFKGSAVVCANSCDAGNNVVVFNGNTLPTGIFVNPTYNNTTDLLANQLLPGVSPNCSGFTNTTACMGWNANSRVLTNPSVIYDLQPDPNCGSVANQCVGKGFQLPSTTCASSGDVFNDYPAFLKGMVYLHTPDGFVSGARIFQYHDLATTKCGL